MERWNELIAGHVLGNLTESEQAELSKVLSKNPQMVTQIARLRRTATLRSGHKKEQTTGPSASQLSEGAEGWADMVAQLPDMTPEMMADVLNNDQGNVYAPATLLSKSFSAENSAVRHSLFEPPEPSQTEDDESANGASLSQGAFRANPLEKQWGQRFVQWIVVLLIVGMGLDNWRLRRMLAIAQERILELESTAEMVPIPSSID